MDALKLSFPQKIGFPTKAAASAPVQDQAAFASLLDSLSVEAELPSEAQADGEELVESLESLLAFLQELPVDEQTPEQQDIQYAIIQLLDLQAGNAEISLPVFSQTSGKIDLATNDAEKLIGLLEKIQQQLKIISAEFTTEFAGPSVFTGATEKNNGATLKDLTQISKQLGELIAILEKEQQAMLPTQQVKTIEQTIKNLAPVEGLKPVPEVPQPVIEIQETVKQAGAPEPQLAGKLQITEEIQTAKLPVESKVPQEPAVQPAAAVATEAGKTAGNHVRTEANPPPAPFIRLSNLLEDLGGMLKSSMRLAESQEGMKMRVNIFPEHLGHLEILLTSTNGKLAAQIMASTPMAKEALELQLNQLRASLVQQGITVEKIEVLQQSSQQSFSQQNPHADQRFAQSQQGQGSASRDRNGYFKAEEDPAAERRTPLGDGLMKVDYTV